MSKSNSLENSWLLHLLNNSAIANVGDATGLRGSSAAGSLYVSLHTGDPGEAGDQTTNECAYVPYLRIAVARTSGGWTVVAYQGANAAQITFARCTSGSESITHFGLGTALSGAGVLLYSGALTTPLAVSVGIQPDFPAGDFAGAGLLISED